MLSSFLQQLPADAIQRTEVDTTTSGESAFVYTGRKTQVPKGTTRLRVHKSAKNLDGALLVK